MSGDTGSGFDGRDELIPLESNALKWVLLCERYEYDPTVADVTYFEPRHLSAKLGIDPNHEHVHFAVEFPEGRNDEHRE